MEPLSESQVIENLRQTEDPSAQYYAAWWLGKMRSRHHDAIPLEIKQQILAEEPVPLKFRRLLRNASGQGQQEDHRQHTEEVLSHDSHTAR